MNAKWIILIVACTALSACSAVNVRGNAANVILADAQPPGGCHYLGEAIGSQGNWFTGDYTSNANLMKGARNELRNKAAAMGGDYVWVQNLSNAHAHGALGTSNTTVTGNVYACNRNSRMSMQNVAPTTTTAMTSSQSQVGSRTMSRAGSAAQVLSAQRTATAQSCGDVRNYAEDEYVAKCSAGTLIIRCEGNQCRPVQMKW